MESNRSSLSVSVVICTYSRAALLQQTLLSLESVSGIAKAEVIVVDNNSPDHTSEIVAKCIERLRGKVNLKYVFEARQGLSVARNRGIAESSGSIIAFLDDDAIPSSSWLTSVQSAFERYPDAAAIGGIIHPNFETSKPDWLVKELELGFTIVNLGDKERMYPRRLHPFGANMAIRKDIFKELRFPEELGRKGNSLLSGEESWLFEEIQSQGKKLIYIPGMSVAHFIDASRLRPEWIKRRYYYQGVSLAVWNNRLPARIRLVLFLLVKRGYLLINSLFIRSPGQRLVQECRMESIRGSVETLRSRGAIPAYE